MRAPFGAGDRSLCRRPRRSRVAEQTSGRSRKSSIACSLSSTGTPPCSAQVLTGNPVVMRALGRCCDRFRLADDQLSKPRQRCGAKTSETQIGDPERGRCGKMRFAPAWAMMKEIWTSDEVDLLKRVYDRFNAHDMETVLAAMHEDVAWANGMEGGHVHGRDEVQQLLDTSVDDDRSARRAGRVRSKSRRGSGCGNTSGRARPQRESSSG